MRKSLLFSVYLSFLTLLIAKGQYTIDSPFTEGGQRPLVSQEQRQRLMGLSEQFDSVFTVRRGEAIELAREYDLPVRYRDLDGRVYELQYFDEFGLPVYFSTRNAGAARTTLTSNLHPTGSLRLFLTGLGMTAGVWDAGAIENSHDELRGRVSIRDTGVLDDHATHVGGTVIASGLNASAKGMAPEANLLSYDWNNDLSEMASAAANGLILSNHSYGINLGWNWRDGKWEWLAHSDSLYDYRFGFYSNLSRSIDQLAFNAPHYLIVWAAGNDRNDVGDGSRPADGPYDTIGPEGVAKNALSVGAVRKILNGYSSSSDVVMSNFSSWGPTDDGRIKPDLVATGVQIQSTITGNSYATYGGTSMAAPNVTGSLLLLQQLYRDNHPEGRFLKAASLKGLAIHTAFEAGSHAGPDYRYGWGLLNTDRAARFILAHDDVDYVLKEISLEDQAEYAFEFDADGSGDIVATLSWTDHPGSPVVPSMNPRNQMLVNDLDIRIYAMDDERVFMPWRLNVESPVSPATRGDNRVDNVERINITNPAPGSYRLVVSHKDSLVGGRQDFSLILQTQNIPQRKTFYWIAGSGNWSDGANWSFSSGGAPAGESPGIDDHVVVDTNSFLNAAPQQLAIHIDTLAAAYSFSWFNNRNVQLTSDGHGLWVYSSIYLDPNNSLAVSDLDVFLTGDSPNNVITMPGENLSGLNLVFDGTGSWRVTHDMQLNRVILKNGQVQAAGRFIELGYLEIVGRGEAVQLDFRGSTLTGLRRLILESSTPVILAEASEIIFSGDPANGFVLEAEGVVFGNVTSLEGAIRLSGSNHYQTLTLGGEVTLEGDSHMEKLILMPGTVLSLQEGSLQTIHSGGLEIHSEAENKVVLESSGEEVAMISVLAHLKLCFDYLIINGVGVEGDAVFNAGTTSELDERSFGWLTMACDDVLFADFTTAFACARSLASLRDASTGRVESWLWEVNLHGEIHTFAEPVIEVVFPDTGYYEVSLAVSNDQEVSRVVKDVFVRSNNLAATGIVQSGTRYTSVSIAPNYQWYRNGEPIPDAVLRFFDNTEQLGGVFRVLLSNNVCNIFTEPLIVVSAPDKLFGQQALQLYPNPAKAYVMLTGELPGITSGVIDIIDMQGRIVYSERFYGQELTGKRIDISGVKQGMYLVRIYTGTHLYSLPLLIQY